MDAKSLPTSFLALVIAALLLGCPLPTTPGAGGTGGSLTIQVGNRINSQTLLPPISMTPASYTLSGTGPGGATFSQTTTGGPVTVDHLAFGSWNITVNAMNADGTLIGSGNSSATVHTGQTTTVAISVVPLTGNGSLNLTVSWTASQVEIPSIVASLTPPTGPATTLSFSVNGSQATYSSTSIPAGYQTLTVQLMDNNIAVMGAVEVVRIVAGQTTTGTYAFTNANQPGGTVVVNITPEMADPIPVSISGVSATITAGTSVTATASVSDGTTGVVYVWYLNGVSVGTGPSFTFGSALAAGYYRLDVTAYTATRAGSATASFQATSAVLGSRIYAALYGGGLAISRDGGSSWTTYTTAQGLASNSVVRVFAVGSTIYASTSDAGLSISTNDGLTWTNYTTAQGLIDNDVTAVYAVGSTIYAGTYGGLSVSTNGGLTWTNYTSAQGLAGNLVYGVYVVGSTIYTATVGGGLSISTNGGSTWTIYRTAEGLGSTYTTGVYAIGSTIYAATVTDSSGPGGLSISTDSGASWTNYTTAQGLGSNVVYGVYAVGSTIYAATNGGLSISTNGGSNWTNYSMAQGLPSLPVWRVYVTGSVIYAATVGGLSVSTNGGSTWTNYLPGNVYGVFVQ